MQRLLATSLVAVLCLACAKKTETVSTASNTTSSTQTTASAAATTSNMPAHSNDDLVALSSGAVPVVNATPVDANGEAWHMLDEDGDTGWSSNDVHWKEPTVIELADRSVIRNVAFDLQHDEWEGRVPKEVTVEVSDTSATDGFKPIVDVTIPQKLQDNVTFPATAEVPGRWVRLTVKSLYSGDIVQVMEFRAYGDRLTHNPSPNITGSYKSADGEDYLYVSQNGTNVTGCYAHGLAPLVGGMEGRLLKYSYELPADDSGPAIAIFSNDGSVFAGRWKTTGVSAEHPKMSPAMYKKTSDTPGKCPNEKKPEDQLASDLKQKGRVRLYGINFDSDSANIRGESKPTLDLVAQILKTNPDLKITIEGHTDSTSTPEHNQQLSEARANAVKTYLTNAGIDAARLNAAGFGATKPVATNDNALGRAENRRVELARN